MLPFEPEEMADLKKRFYKALESPIDAILVQAGVQEPASGNRTHVFDFQDGMRMCVSIDLIEGVKYLHISASGNEDYAATIRDEGLDGFIEDITIRVASFCNDQPGEQVHCVMTQAGVLHMIFEVDDYEGLVERSKGTGSGD